MTLTTWIIGSGGLLGRALTRAVAVRGGWHREPSPALDWADPQAVHEVVSARLQAWFDGLAGDDEWCLIWAAGAGVIGTSPAQFAAELAQFTEVLALVETAAARHGVAARGSVFLASSAGGLYGGSSNPPYTEGTVPVPLSPYGETKLAMEEALDAFHRRSGVAVLKGRIANLYGPGQKLSKMQGLISTLAKAQFSPTPASIFVPLDTVRDYIFVDDCAELICDAVERLLASRASEGALNVTKILASGEAVTVGALIGHFQSLTRRKPHIMLGSSPTISMQALDLRLRSVVWVELDDRELTPLPAGIHASMLDILQGIQQG
ncbi:nucleoside-diphosphate sugar epimerase [Subtercola sp. Z020]|uniref:NAD-dependent epimerase/dehydratase family protein n=1 Tax=Subtercola sp. Z020 TaxID=2080582 RepID=UPI000CE8E74B|nr:NAD-dependent epimerase/dehydratase family protein [Subtercola sp. Z020]PPF82459.1 nucleoside-diphosphate sugar epimerase [Subtercola sp. Z020]